MNRPLRDVLNRRIEGLYKSGRNNSRDDQYAQQTVLRRVSPLESIGALSAFSPYHAPWRRCGRNCPLVMDFHDSRNRLIAVS